MNTQLNTITPRVYVACLADYNNGHLHGKWIGIESEEQIRKDINKILKTSPIPDAEEWAIHDHEGIGNISEYEGIDNLIAYADFIKEHGEMGLSVLEHYNNDIDEATNALENFYHGEYDSEEDFVIQFTEDTGMEIPKHLAYYIDYEKMTRDYFINDFFSIDYGSSVLVFSNH